MCNLIMEIINNKKNVNHSTPGRSCHDQFSKSEQKLILEAENQGINPILHEGAPPLRFFWNNFWNIWAMMLKFFEIQY